LSRRSLIGAVQRIVARTATMATASRMTMSTLLQPGRQTTAWAGGGSLRGHAYRISYINPPITTNRLILEPGGTTGTGRHQRPTAGMDEGSILMQVSPSLLLLLLLCICLCIRQKQLSTSDYVVCSIMFVAVVYYTYSLFSQPSSCALEVHSLESSTPP